MIQRAYQFNKKNTKIPKKTQKIQERVNHRKKKSINEFIKDSSIKDVIKYVLTKIMRYHFSVIKLAKKFFYLQLNMSWVYKIQKLHCMISTT